jgi:hypothetical protein
LSFYRVALEPNKTVLHITLKSGPIAKSGFQRFPGWEKPLKRFSKSVAGCTPC